jgi:DNA-binding SARP family transcriptional activator
MYSIDENKTPISIRMLGECNVYFAGKIAHPTFNFLRILAYLIIEGRGRPVPRRRIANLIWSDNPSEQVNADIRQAVARIRRFQEEHKFQLLASDATMVWLNAGQDIYTDLQEFQHLVANPGPKAWVRLCEIYNGDLLGTHRPAGEGFEEWLDHHRTALRFEYINTISHAVLPTSLMTHKERHFCASRLLAEDPYHEGAHRALMYEAAMNGDFSFLRHLFQECTSVLRRELGINPTEETVTFYKSLMSRAPVA